MNALAPFVALVAAYVAGGLVLWNLWPGRTRPVVLLGVFALPTGVGVTSVAFFLWRLIPFDAIHLYRWIEVFFLVAAVLGTRHRFKRKGRGRIRITWPGHFVPARDGLAMIGLVSAVAVAAVHTGIKAAGNSWGVWDAWARINLKARFLYGGGMNWKWIFESDDIRHRDYPLLVECSVARLWSWSGNISLLEPQVISMLCGAASLAVLVSAVWWVGTPLLATIVALAYLANTTVSYWAAMQYADLPLITYVIMASAMFAASQRYRSHQYRFTLLAGVFAGLAAWCKNEGIAFVLVLMAIYLLTQLRRRKQFWTTFGMLAIGLATSGLAVLILKIGFCLKDEILRKRTESMMTQFLDGERHRMIFEAVLQEGVKFWELGALALLAVAAAIHLSTFERRQTALVLLGFAILTVCYYLALVAASPDLNWHLTTALQRLMLQLWPLGLLGTAYLRRPDRRPNSR